MEPRHDGAHRDVEDLGRVGVAELADVDEDDDVAEVVRQLGERADDVVLREPLDDALLVERLLALGGRELVGEEVVALLERLLVGRPLELAPAIEVQVRQDPEEPGAHVRARACRSCQLRNALTYVSCTSSSASSRVPTSRRATR